MGLVENGLLKEKKHYYSSTRPDPAYKEYEKCVIWRKPSIHLSCLWYCWNCTVARIVSECSKLAQKKNKQVRHDIVKMLRWKLCEKWGFNKAEELYIHKP